MRNKTQQRQREERLAETRRYLKDSPGLTPSALARLSGWSFMTCARMLLAVRESEGKQTEQTAPTAPSVGMKLLSTDDASCEVVRDNPCTLDDLLAACRIDLARWRVARWVANKWEVGAKQADGKVLRTPLYQVKAWLEPVPGREEADVIHEAIEWVRQHSPAERAVPASKPALPAADPHMFEISIPDLHLGKLVWPDETGADYNTAIAESLFMQAVENLWRRASVFPVERVLFPLGNDLLNVDSMLLQTTAGTPQQEDGRWQRSFQRAVALAHRGIEFLRGRTSGGIDVPIVPGNHDSQRCFYLGEVLRAMYVGTEDVRVDNSPNPRKYFRYGATLLGLTHGHAEKHDRLPLIMAGERSADWAQTAHHEWHLGHLHHARETRYHAGQEFGPVRVRILPSLTAADSWHHMQGYVGAKRAAEAYLWSFKFGYSGHLSWGVPNDASAR